MASGKVVFGLCLLLCLLGVRGAFAIHENQDAQPDESGNAYTARIVINIPARTLSLYDNDNLVYEFPVAVGAPQYKTPTGPRHLSQIVWNPWWLPPDSPWAKDSKPTPPGPGNPLGTVKMVLGKAILLHGTNKESTVGTPASHGCMRMFNKDAATLAWWIQSHFTNQNDPALMETYQNSRGRSFYVNLLMPIPVEIRYDLFQVEKKNLRVHPDIYREGEDRTKLAYAFLEENGYNTDKVNENALSRILWTSREHSGEISLRELIPGKLSASRNRIPDPVDEAWKSRQNHRHTRKPHSQKISSLFDSHNL